MKLIVRAFYLILFTAFFSLGFADGDLKTIAVAGFINQGDKPDDSVNKVISRSLITFLAKVRDVKVASYEAVEKLASENGFWASKELKAETATEMGLNLAVKRVVTGTYKINKKKDTIQITVLVYDPATSELKLKREYSGEAGIGIFDTIDRLVRNISVELVGHAIAMGKLQIQIDSDNSYKLYINDVFQSKLDKSSGFSETELAEEPMVISLRLPTEVPVYQEKLTLKDGETRDITYAPSGSVNIKTGKSGVKVYVDDTFAGVTGDNGELEIKNVTAGKEHNIRAEEPQTNMGLRTVSIEEGKSYSLGFGNATRPFFFPVHILQGGFGGTLGVDYMITDYLRASLLGGAVVIKGAFIPIADVDISLLCWRIADFSFWIAAGGFSYFTSPITISPLLRLEVSWLQFFIEGGARYGFDNGSINPMIGIGYRF